MYVMYVCMYVCMQGEQREGEEERGSERDI